MRVMLDSDTATVRDVEDAVARALFPYQDALEDNLAQLREEIEGYREDIRTLCRVVEALQDEIEQRAEVAA